MGVKAKIIISILLVTILGISLWQFTAPQIMPPVGQKYAKSAAYASRGGWTVQEKMSYGTVFLVFSMANTTTPQVSLPPTIYSLVISDDNQTVSNSFVRGFGIRVATLTLQDNYDGSRIVQGNNYLADAVQVTSSLSLKTSGLHRIAFTINYQTVDLLLVGYTNDHLTTRSFNITQLVN